MGVRYLNEQLGIHGVTVAIDSGSKATTMTILDEVIEVCLEERRRQVEYEPTPKELRKSERLKHRTYPLYKRPPNEGRLV